MKIRQVKVELSKTIQAVKFEPVTATYGLTADLEVGDDEVAARQELYKLAAKGVRIMMKKELEQWRADHEKWHEENS